MAARTSGLWSTSLVLVVDAALMEQESRSHSVKLVSVTFDLSQYPAGKMSHALAKAQVAS